MFTPHLNLHIYSSDLFLSHLLLLSLSSITKIHSSTPFSTSFRATSSPSSSSSVLDLSLSISSFDFLFDFSWRVIISITITGSSSSNNIIINSNNIISITTLKASQRVLTWTPRIGSPNGASRRQKSSS